MKFKFQVDFIQEFWTKLEEVRSPECSCGPAWSPISLPAQSSPPNGRRSSASLAQMMFVHPRRSMRWSPLRTRSRKGMRWRKEIHPAFIYLKNMKIIILMLIYKLMSGCCWPLWFHSIRLYFLLFLDPARLRHSQLIHSILKHTHTHT